MDRLIYTALTGLAGRSRSQAVTANNLANAGTTGFRREIIAAESRYLTADNQRSRVESVGARSRVESVGARSRVQAGAPSVATPHDPGKADPTGRPLDIALAGDAWLAVQGPILQGQPTEAYTRRGDLSITLTGILQNGDGRAVLSVSGTPITIPPGASLDIAPDGSLTTRAGDTVTPLGQLKLVNGAGLTDLAKGADGQFTSKTSLPADPLARLTTGSLETSNVQTAGALAELVEQSRGFEVNARLLGIAKDIDERTARLMALDSQ